MVLSVFKSLKILKKLLIMEGTAHLLDEIDSKNIYGYLETKYRLNFCKN